MGAFDKALLRLGIKNKTNEKDISIINGVSNIVDILRHGKEKSRINEDRTKAEKKG